MRPILEIQNVSKKYRISHLAGGYLSLRERLTSGIFGNGTRKEDFLALNDVSFSVMPGESIGIIGRNGAGKSTLLKILSRITPPTQGRIITRGRIASLLEVGTGFHPELTGRENIFFNGSLLGMTRKEIQSKFDEIVDFSGVEKFLDTPLKHYSSGMQLRLAFSVAAFLEPEILVIDEVLAVGDAEFQKKCIGKMEDVSRGGRTILFVSHNMTAVESLCRKSLLLRNGSLANLGQTKDVVLAYQQEAIEMASDHWERDEGAGTPALFFRSVSARLTGDQPRHSVVVDMELESTDGHPRAFIAIDVANSFGYTFMQAIPTITPFINQLNGQSRRSRFFQAEIDLPPLVPDKYFISLWVGAHNLDTLDAVKNAVSFDITESPTVGRTFPHTPDHGCIVPLSKITEYEK